MKSHQPFLKGLFSIQLYTFSITASISVIDLRPPNS